MTRFFNFIGASWWIIVLTIAVLIFFKCITSLVFKSLKDSEISLFWKIIIYLLFAIIWVLLLVIAIPLIVKYLIGIY